METYAQLPAIRNALKQATLEHNALYWDIFEVMGGAGSMAAWVQSSPALASSDHIHFTTNRSQRNIRTFSSIDSNRMGHVAN